MTDQLRIYTLHEGSLDRFVEEWRERVCPLRRQFGFTVKGAWRLDGENRFVWILGYDGEDGFAARDAAYYASPERQAIEPDPGRHVQEATTQLMEPVEST